MSDALANQISYFLISLMTTITFRMLRPCALVLVILLIGFICIDSQDWEDPYQQWKLIHKGYLITK